MANAALQDDELDQSRQSEHRCKERERVAHSGLTSKITEHHREQRSSVSGTSELPTSSERTLASAVRLHRFVSCYWYVANATRFRVLCSNASRPIQRVARHCQCRIRVYPIAAVKILQHGEAHAIGINSENRASVNPAA